MQFITAWTRIPSMRQRLFAVFFILAAAPLYAERPYTIVGTGQTKCYDNRREIEPPKADRPFYGQDAQHPGPKISYKDNGDGTVSDRNTELMWVKARGPKMTWQSALNGAKTCRVGKYDDWRMPTIKELYSLINFTGEFRRTAAESKPYLDAAMFEFVYGDEQRGERGIDCQDWSATEYVGKTMLGNETVFGVNFADGRIKGYGKNRPGPNGGPVKHYVRYVRGNPKYGRNDFHDNGNGTITDRATGLMWQQADSGRGMDWQHALSHASAFKLAGRADWRLPNAKELQSIVDYTRIPAIPPMFKASKLSDGETPYYWTSTTHLDGPPDRLGGAAVYIAFGRALGWMKFPSDGETFRLLDVHGAGSQRSDPKTGDPKEFPHGRGPQGDVIRIQNYVRLVRNIDKA
jgi:hypothetical protein